MVRAVVQKRPRKSIASDRLLVDFRLLLWGGVSKSLFHVFSLLGDILEPTWPQDGPEALSRPIFSPFGDHIDPVLGYF